jgi:hypothetical protein
MRKEKEKTMKNLKLTTPHSSKLIRSSAFISPQHSAFQCVLRTLKETQRVVCRPGQVFLPTKFFAKVKTPHAMKTLGPQSRGCG